MNRRTTITIILILVLVVGLGLFLVLRSSNQPTEVQAEIFTDETTGLQLSYRSPLVPSELSAQDREDKFLFRLTSPSPAILVSVRYEDGLRTVSSLSKLSIIDLLSATLSKSLEQRYPEYKQTKYELTEVAGKQAIRTDFTYKGPSGEQAKQRLLVIQVDDDRAVYISGQTKAEEFDTLEEKHLRAVFESVRF